MEALYYREGAAPRGHATLAACKRAPKRARNPFHRDHYHVTPLLTDWAQVEHWLLRVRKEYVDGARPLPPVPSGLQSADEDDAHPLGDAVRASLASPVYADPTRVEETLRYLFYHMRCGIYVMIRNNVVAMFVPFVNRFYRNGWPDLPYEGGSRQHYYAEKSRSLRIHEKLMADERRWWGNGHLLCNVQPANLWGDHFMAHLRDMLETTCRTHRVPDAEFFLNKRDHPQLRHDRTEPYHFFFQEAKPPLRSEKFSSYCPIASFYTSDEFADIAWPLPEDWELATERHFPPCSKDLTPLFTAQVPAWEDKRAVAFFRGGATGAGTTPATNQRLRLAQLARQEDPDGAKLDVGLTAWNVRDKKRAPGSPVRCIRPEKLQESAGLGLSDFVPLKQQLQYRYILYVEGHCAASRYSFLLRTGSVILKVDSTTKADQLWFFPLMEPYQDHIPVKADLSDLLQKVAWCQENDDKCRAIARRARAFYDAHLSRAAITRYCATTLAAVGAAQAAVGDRPSRRISPEDQLQATPHCSGYPPPDLAYLETWAAEFEKSAPQGKEDGAR